MDNNITNRGDVFLAKIAGRNVDLASFTPPVASGTTEKLLLEIADRLDTLEGGGGSGGGYIVVNFNYDENYENIIMSGATYDELVTALRSIDSGDTKTPIFVSGYAFDQGMVMTTPDHIDWSVSGDEVTKVYIWVTIAGTTYKLEIDATGVALTEQ